MASKPVSMTSQKVLSPAARAKRIRLRDSFEFYAPRVLKIRTKSGAIRSFHLNTAQLYLHQRIEDQRRRTGKVRIVIVKGRQQGCSTYVEGRFFWRVSQQRGKRAFILTHMDDATTNLFGMAKRYYEHCPPIMRPVEKSNNAKELYFALLDSGYRVGTAGSKGTGRSDTIQYFHGSEVAYWPNAETHVAGAMQAVPDEAGTEVILESTANGPTGIFHEYVIAALRDEKRIKQGKSRLQDYELVFIPWYWQKEYRRSVPTDFQLTSEESQYKRKYELSNEQIMWRRMKIGELRGVHNFRREYPATVEEAFSAERPGALWQRETIEKHRWPTGKELPRFRRIVIGVDPSGGDKPENDEQGIVAAGLLPNGHVIVITDATVRKSPQGWGTTVCDLFDELKADRVVAEKNYGGDMVKSTIQTVDPGVPVKLVTASRGKDVRAEPVSSLYDQGLIHHAEEFVALENEMVTWVPGDPKSPNRLDALVWAVTELKLGHRKPGIAKPGGVGQSAPAHIVTTASGYGDT